MKSIIVKRSSLKPIAANKDAFPWLITESFNFYNMELKPKIAEVCSQKMDGYHGLNTHTNAVVFRGIDYALHLGCEPLPVVFACAFHDIARINDDMDMEHGRNAVPLAIKIMKQFPTMLDKDTRMSILSAVMNHTNGGTAPNYISACLWDADRTRLAWKYGFEEKFFNTERGKYVAQHCQKYLEYQRKNFKDFDWSKQY